ncbi:MAG: RNA polymerase sigma-I factor [Bacillota bacterium]|nr:RNA polymerase sigma-I factor [Bacillota bacterium]REJ38037.1 MAG: RNA polymerase sigma-I factor [Bacillota bacterium]
MMRAEWRDLDETHVIRLLKAATGGDDGSREELLRHYRPLAVRVARQVCRRFVDEHDDEYSVALLALNEAIDGYEASHGARFEGYARMVIRRRLIDHMRREQRHRHLSIEPEAAPIPDVEANPAEFEAAWVRYEAAERARDLAEEVARFRAQLREFGMDLADLAQATPRHQDTREAVQEVARVLARDEVLFRQMLRTRRLPIQELMMRTGASRKVLETWRRYIVALALILGGDYEGMRGHLGA